MAGTALLERLHDDPLAIVKALREERWFELAAAVEIAEKDVDAKLALTDPALYRSMREAITLFYLKGYGAFDIEKIRRKANPDMVDDRRV